MAKGVVVESGWQNNLVVEMVVAKLHNRRGIPRYLATGGGKEGGSAPRESGPAR